MPTELSKTLTLPDLGVVEDPVLRQVLNDFKKAIEEVGRAAYEDVAQREGAVPAIVLGTAAVEGTANSLVRTDATIVAFDATNPADLGTAAPGSATVAARRDHVHTLPVPAGTIAAYGGTSAPSGWLLCDGTAVSRTTYAALFTAISTNYGTGDGSTTFNVPDFRGRAAIGTGQGSGLTNRTVGGTVGTETHPLVESEIPGHTHTGPSHTHTTPAHTHSTLKTTLGGGGTAAYDFTTSSSESSQATGNPPGTTEGGGTSGAEGTGASGSTGGGGAHQNMQPSLVATYIIKT